MSNLKEKFNDEWKDELRTYLITSVINGQNTEKSITERIGYYYMYYAPAFLYRYFPDSSRALENLKTNKIWFSAPCKFNDVFDCDIVIDDKQVFQSALKLIPDKRGVRRGSHMWCTLNQSVNSGLRSLKSDFERLKTTTGIFCMSELYDSLLMWAHYANNHCGMCVEYKLLDINKQLHYSPVPVIYSDERSSFCSIDPNTIETDTTSLFIKSLTSKSPEWSYEREWRIIQDENACDINWDNKEKGALLNMLRPRSIILGCMAKEEFEKEIREYCEKNKINLYKMEKNKSIYRIDRIPVLQFD